LGDSKTWHYSFLVHKLVQKAGQQNLKRPTRRRPTRRRPTPNPTNKLFAANPI